MYFLSYIFVIYPYLKKTYLSFLNYKNHFIINIQNNKLLIMQSIYWKLKEDVSRIFKNRVIIEGCGTQVKIHI
jgi:hypothetical protein